MNSKLSFLLCSLFSIFMLHAQKTEIQYLSGTGLGDTKTWDFYCSGGMNSGKWSKIEVPSQWELQGFGNYTFGRFYLDKTAKPSDETGKYKHAFKVPSSWKNKQVCIVFEGVMTDTKVTVNGQSAGEIHQGGFVQFEYDISDKIKFGKTNSLEVQVWKESANSSVNAAERRADWWLFGGIYRPVYLKATPKTNIQRIAVDAKADGSLQTEVHFYNLPDGCSLQTQLFPLESATSIGSVKHQLTNSHVQTIRTDWANIKSWDNEHPNLYVLQLDLLDKNGAVMHTHRERIGFRTIEFRYKDGIYVNGTKLIVKGINRHSFHPDGGRTTNKAISLQDALLIKEMNMNAVRSHYPPDKHFLDICDSLGLFYLNELPGWHNKYGNQVGEKILKEMLVRDVNHPSIFMWSNGNEGGWNTHLDTLFAVYDPQKRHVIHPWADFNGIDTHHYPTYQTGTYRLANGYHVFMPTEFLHGQYDKGLGAGLDDFWDNYTANPLFAGGFLWTYVDEAVRRTDQNDKLDSDGPNGPDGVVGPYREKEGSFYTIREVWSPIQIHNLHITSSFNGKFLVSNEYLFSKLGACSMQYRLYNTPSPLQGGEQMLIGEGKVRLPDLSPGERGWAYMEIPENFFRADILELEAFDLSGRAVCTWTKPVKYAKAYFSEQISTQDAGTQKTANPTVIDVQAEFIKLKAQHTTVSFDPQNGNLISISVKDSIIPFNNGPQALGFQMKFRSAAVRMDGDDALFVVKYTGAVDSIVWRLQPNGLLGMDALLLNKPSGGGFKGEFFDSKINHFGFSFSFPEKEVKGMRWMGRGPYRVWKNRIKGTNYGIWEKAYNNTITGESFENLIYPEFKGYHANVYWASLQTTHSISTIYSETDGLYFRIFTPEEPAMRRDGKNTMEDFPTGDLSFLLEIPAIQSFKTIPELGPKSQPSSIRIKQGDEGFRIKLWFDFKII